MPSVCRSPQATAYAVVHINAGQTCDLWASGEPAEPKPWVSTPSRYVGVPGWACKVVLLAPPSARRFPTFRAARAWVHARYKYLRDEHRKHGIGPSIIPLPAWMVDRLTAQAAGSPCSDSSSTNTVRSN